MSVKTPVKMLETARFFIYNKVIVMEYFLQQGLFWESGLCFSCNQCSACCRYDPGFVYLSPRDLRNLQTWASLERPALIQKYCRWVLKGDGYEYLCLRNFRITIVFYGIMAVLHIIIGLFNALHIHFGIIYLEMNSVGVQMPAAVRE